jgi:hypothetical protein
MKNTNYLINGNYIKFENIIINKPILQQASIMICIPVVVTIFFIIGGCLPYAMVLDAIRYFKYKHIKHIREEILHLN